jgi:RsiW-degrading membrane proteinase PrsW (M82 family)
VLRLFLYKNPNFDEVMDGIVYMAIVSLGFAGFENIMYSAGDIGTGFIRAFTAVPGHAMWSGIMGYYIGCAKIRKTNTAIYFLNGLAWGILYHGLYDFFLFSGSNPELANRYIWLALLIFPVLIVGWIHLRRLIKKAKAEDAAMGIVPVG